MFYKWNYKNHIQLKMNEVLAMLKLAYEAFASVLRQFVFS